MKEYICKIASIDEVITKWNYEIRKQKRKQKKSALELVKNNAVENIKNGQAVIYYGKLNDKIICQATAMFDEDIIQNSDGLVGTQTVYLCNFSTDKKHQGKGYGFETCQVLINKLFEKTDYEYIAYNAYKYNKASIALAKKLGASYIGCKSTFDMLKKSEVSNETKTEAEQFDKMLYRIYR